MSGILSRFSGKRRIVAAALASLAAVAVVAAILSVSLHPQSAHGQGAGNCSPNAPVCTGKGASAEANFQTANSEGCDITQVSFFLVTNLSQPGGASSQLVSVSYSRFDFCDSMDNPLSMEGTNNDPVSNTNPFTGSVAFGPNLSSGSLNGTAPIYDNNTGQLLFTTTINMTWQGFGVTTKSLDNSHMFSQGLIVSMHINGDSRQAVATGVFTDETGTNAITGPTLDAEMFSSSGGQVMITKP